MDNKGKKVLLLIALALSMVTWKCSFSSNRKIITKEEVREYPVADIPSADRATDMVLIYHGYKSRPAWDNTDMKPYIFRDNQGKTEWLFDGFLFLEIFGSRDSVEYDFCIPHDNRMSPDKSLWEELLKKTFAKGTGPDAIEETIDSLVRLDIRPPYKRKVMFALPNPQVQCKNWGSVNGKELDCTKVADRLIAVKWYVQNLLDNWNKKNYKYIDLAGFYWLHEQIDSVNQDDILIKEVQTYLNHLGYSLTWIPYYGAEGAERWKEMGFDIAYQQPNYFFNTSSPISIITGAIDFAKKNNMSLEMEFDERVTDPAYGKRFYTYLEQFEEAGAWEQFPIAYYEGGGAWLAMSRSQDPELQKMYTALSDILVRRNGRFSTIK